MATRELVKKEAAKKEAAISPFVIFNTEIADIREASVGATMAQQTALTIAARIRRRLA
jgi:hypothetical protein